MMSQSAPLTVLCPLCGARPGLGCMGMEPLSYHAMRRVAADVTAAVHNADRKAERQRQRKFRILQEILKP
jgi:hypothetical protein